MIVIRLNLWQLVKMLFGWYIQIELWPRNAQSYSQYMLAPWVKERQFQTVERSITQCE